MRTPVSRFFSTFIGFWALCIVAVAVDRAYLSDGLAPSYGVGLVLFLVVMALGINRVTRPLTQLEVLGLAAFAALANWLTFLTDAWLRTQGSPSASAVLFQLVGCFGIAYLALLTHSRYMQRGDVDTQSE